MNLVGKILTVVIFILSVVFMTMVLVVYATHKNWRDAVITPPDQATVAKPLGLKSVLEEETKKNEALKTELDQLTQEKNKEFEAKVQALTKLENENSLMKDQITALQQSVDKYTGSERESVAALKATQGDSAKFRQEVEGYRSEAEQAKSDRNANFKEVVRLTDEMHQSLNEMTELKSRNATLKADLEKAQQVQQHFDH
jgi:chromosome segregation ATPase